MSAKRRLVFPLLLLLAGAVILPMGPHRGEAGQAGPRYKVLPPIGHDNLVIFPVVAERTYDTHNFLTLDEGVRSGSVVVTEAGRIRPLIRRRPGYIPPSDGAEVNRLVLENNSDRPLILLAGEIVTGGKQDRVVGKDRIVPADSDPIDLSVFCVEPERWEESKPEFGSLHSQMAQPSVRRSAMADQNQAEVWAEVGKAKQSMAAGAAMAAAPQLAQTSSYARTMDNPEVKHQVDTVAAPIEQSYLGVMHELRERNAVGVVVAVNGRIIWADLFASTSLLEKYWPKLIRSYAAEALTRHFGVHPALERKGERVWQDRPSVGDAQAFLQDSGARHEEEEGEPGVYRRTEFTGNGFTAFALTSLLPGAGFDVHVAKMAD